MKTNFENGQKNICHLYCEYVYSVLNICTAYVNIHYWYIKNFLVFFSEYGKCLSTNDNLAGWICTFISNFAVTHTFIICAKFNNLYICQEKFYNFKPLCNGQEWQGDDNESSLYVKEVKVTFSPHWVELKNDIYHFFKSFHNYITQMLSDFFNYNISKKRDQELHIYLDFLASCCVD